MGLPDSSIYHATQHRKQRIIVSLSFDNKHRNIYIYIITFIKEDSIIQFFYKIIILDTNSSGIKHFKNLFHLEPKRPLADETHGAAFRVERSRTLLQNDLRLEICFFDVTLLLKVRPGNPYSSRHMIRLLFKWRFEAILLQLRLRQMCNDTVLLAATVAARIPWAKSSCLTQATLEQCLRCMHLVGIRSLHF